VSSALNEGLVTIQKLIFQPFQIDASMRATVDKSMELTVLMNEKNTEIFTINIKVKGLAAGIRDDLKQDKER